jgi:adenine deaminase
MEEESLSFHVVDGYNLQSGLLASTITKDAMFSLASTGNDKGYMFVANKIGCIWAVK